jgi:threonine synthase
MAQFSQHGSLSLPHFSSPDFAAGRASTAETLAAMRITYQSSRYILDPHTAVAVHAATPFLDPAVPTVCLATAHPGKFPAAIAEALGPAVLSSHPSLDRLRELPLRKTILNPDSASVQSLMKRTLCP